VCERKKESSHRTDMPGKNKHAISLPMAPPENSREFDLEHPHSMLPGYISGSEQKIRTAGHARYRVIGAFCKTFRSAAHQSSPGTGQPSEDWNIAILRNAAASPAERARRRRDSSAQAVAATRDEFTRRPKQGQITAIPSSCAIYVEVYDRR